jgi:hypothetical protein
VNYKSLWQRHRIPKKQSGTLKRLTGNIGKSLFGDFPDLRSSSQIPYS